MRIFVFKKDTIIRVAAFAVIIAGAAIYTSAVTKADKETFATSGSGMITSAAIDEKDAAITIDTAFGNDVTEEILEILDKHGAKATFAVMGAWAKDNKGLVNRIISEGHEIISHSMVHERYNDIGFQQALKDASAAKEYLKTEFGVDTAVIRPPYGAANEQIISELTNNGFIPVKWSIDSKDWRGEEADIIAANVIDELKPGSIILFQNNNESTPQAIDIVLGKMAEVSYQTLGLSELMEKEGRVF